MVRAEGPLSRMRVREAWWMVPAPYSPRSLEVLQFAPQVRRGPPSRVGPLAPLGGGWPVAHSTSIQGRSPALGSHN